MFAARAGEVTADQDVTVLGPLDTVELSSKLLPVTDVTPADAAAVSVTGPVPGRHGRRRPDPRDCPGSDRAQR